MHQLEEIFQILAKNNAWISHVRQIFIHPALAFEIVIYTLIPIFIITYLYVYIRNIKKNKLNKMIGVSGISKLMYLSSFGKMSEILDELATGSDMNAQSDLGLTPLMFATINEREDVVNFYLTQPTLNFNLKNKDGKTAKDLSYNCKSDIIKNLYSNYRSIDI